ncbi:MAG: hypothetical protein IPG99_15820 [Ignavibacteria bacterium]|nr:hypothetical protein [Ignavibacteria bacterium]
MNRIISLVSFSMFLIIFAMFSCKTDQKSNLDSSSKDERFNEPTSKLAKDSALLSAKKQQEIFVPLALNKVSETQWVCAGQIPNGWVKINDSWNPTTCGNPTSISYNVWLIERYDDKPIGSSYDNL